MKTEALISAYIELRDLKEAREKEHKERQAPITAKMAQIEGLLLQELDAAGLDSMKANGVGTAYVSTTGSATVKAWEATLADIISREDWDMLEARVSKAAVQDYIKSNGEPPPGVEYREIRQVRVRR